MAQLPQFAHVREHLERVQDGYSFIPTPESVYLGSIEDDHFWELVGLRLQGCPVVVLAALRFKRKERRGVPDARESLASYLSANPDPDSPERSRLVALLPHRGQQIPQFLASLRVGKELTPVSIDRLRVELAFDFRADNPEANREGVAAAEPLKSHYFRTVSGHVFRGEAHQVVPTDGPAHRFLAVRSPQQLTAAGVTPLPTLFVAHRFIALQANVTEESARLAAREWMPFYAGAASKQSLIPIAG